MPLFLAVYLIIAGALYSAHKDGIIKDDTTAKMQAFEANAHKGR